MAIPTPDFKIINVSTGDKKEINDRPELTGNIKLLLETERPTVAFVQELNWVGNEGGGFTKADLPDTYGFYCLDSFHSGFIYDKEAIDCQPMEVDSCYEEIKQAMPGSEQNMKSHIIPRLFLCLCRIKSKGLPEFELLCASWHGPKKINKKKKESTTPAKTSEDKDPKYEKLHILCSLMMFLKKVKEKCQLPLMIGGDFNLKSEEVNNVRHEITSNFLMTSPSDDSIMIWLISEDLNETFDRLCHNWARYPAFDHFVLNMSFQRRTPGNNRQVPYWKVNDGNDSDNDDVSEYGLVIRPTELQMMTATWHGADASDSDEEKERSLREALEFLLGKIYKIPKKIQGKYDLAWVLKDRKETSTDTWILSNDKSSLLGLKRDGERLEAIAENLLPMEQRIALPHTTNIHLDMENVRLPCTDGYTISGSLKPKPSINVEQEGNTEGKEEGKEELCKNFHKMAISK